MDGQKVMHMSPPCISTGVLKNAYMYEQTTTEFGVCVVDRKNLN